jgi:RHS repeat-associated protein
LSDTETYTTRFEYDASGNLERKIDKNENPTGYEYDGLGRLSKVTDALNNDTLYAYDARDNLVSLTDAAGNTTRFEYDRNNRLKKEIRPMGEETSYTYDEAGNLVQKIDAKNQKTEYVYDDAGRLADILYYAATDHATPEKTVTFTYDNAGNLKSYDDGTTSAQYDYDDAYRKTNETVNYGSFALSHSYAYYKNGLKKSFTGPDGLTHTYTYDANNQITGVQIPDAGFITYGNYQWNRPTSVTMPGGGAKTYTYDPLMRVKQITSKAPDQSVIMDYQYTYDPMNNIQTKTTEHGPYGYTYDDIYRLTDTDNPADHNDEQFTYDPVGNRLTSADTSGNWAYNPNNELSGYDDTAYAYDANGNMTQKTVAGVVTSYVYNIEDRLSEVWAGEPGTGTLIAAYYYDPFGRRLWKEVSGVRTNFHYTDEGLVGEYDAAGAEIKTYGYRAGSTWTTDPLFMKIGSEYYFYHNDHLGTPQNMTDSNGIVVWSAKYDSFGKAVIGVETVQNNLRFPGQYWDQETKFYYNKNRSYDSFIGRYLKQDPLNVKRFSNRSLIYVENNPIRYSDPLGLCKWTGTISMGGKDVFPDFSAVFSFLPPTFVTGQLAVFYMRLESKCCNNKQVINGNYIAISYGLTIGPLPHQIVHQKFEFEGPDTPKGDDPNGDFFYLSGGVGFVGGYSASEIISGKLKGKGFGFFWGYDAGVDMLLGGTEGDGTLKCCKPL